MLGVFISLCEIFILSFFSLLAVVLAVLSKEINLSLSFNCFTIVWIPILKLIDGFSVVDATRSERN